MPRRDEEFEIEDNRMERYVAGGARNCLDIPEGLKLFNNKREGIVVLEVVPFKVTENQLKFHNTFPKDIRFSKPGKWYYERTYFHHEQVGPDNAKFTCSYWTFGKRCPICDERTVLKASPKEEDRERSYSLRPKERQLFLVRERDEQSWEFKGGVQLWEESNHSFGKQLDTFRKAAPPKKREAYRNFYNPDVGFTVRAFSEKKSTGDGGRSYYLYSIMGFDERPEPLPDDTLYHGYDLDAMVREFGYDELKGIFSGIEEDPEHSEERPEPSSRVVSAPERPQERPEPTPNRNPGIRRTEIRMAEGGVPVREERPAQREPERSSAKPLANDEPYDPAIGDTVSYKRKIAGEIVRCEGVVRTVSDEKKTVTVAEEGAARDPVLDWEDLTLVERASEFDSPPPTKTSATGKTPTSAVSTTANGSAKKGRWDDDGGADDTDDRTFKPKAKPPAEEESQPAKRRR